MRLLWVLPLVAAPAAGPGQGPQARPIYNRDQWLPKSVPTSDDGLRLPVPADYNAPEGLVRAGRRAAVGRNGRAGAPGDDRGPGQGDHRGTESG